MLRLNHSQACPHVAGVAALVWSYFPECSNDQIRSALLMSAADAGAVGCDNQYGHGFVQAEAAYDLLDSQGCGVGFGRIGGCAQIPGSVEPTPAPTPFNCDPAETFTLDLTTDNFGSETTWTIEAAGQMRASGSGYPSSMTTEDQWCSVRRGSKDAPLSPSTTRLETEFVAVLAKEVTP